MLQKFAIFKKKMRKLTRLFLILLIFSCSKYDDPTDILNEVQDEIIQAPQGNDTNQEVNDNNSENTDQNEGDDNSDSSNDDSENNQDQIDSRLFDKWNFRTFSNKQGMNNIDFIILTSDYEYILNMNGSESRGNFSYSNQVINLGSLGTINIVDFDQSEFNFTYRQENGNQTTFKAVSDSNYNDGDCTSFLECVNDKTYSILSTGVYNFVKDIYQDEFFFVHFVNEPEGNWIRVYNNRKLFKLLAFADQLLVNQANVDIDTYSQYDFSLTYDAASDIINTLNYNCESDWSIWTNNVPYFPYMVDAISPLKKNSFRNLSFTLTDTYGREVFQFDFVLNSDNTISYNVNYLPDDNSLQEEVNFGVTTTLKEREINTSNILDNFCLYNESSVPLSDIYGVGYFATDEHFGLQNQYYGYERGYNVFNFWTIFWDFNSRYEIFDLYDLLALLDN